MPRALRSSSQPRCPSSIRGSDESGALSFGPTEKREFAEMRTLSGSLDLREAAANLFRHLRELDDAQLDLIVVEEIPEVGLGRAIMDRLRRAAVRDG